MLKKICTLLGRFYSKKRIRNASSCALIVLSFSVSLFDQTVVKIICGFLFLAVLPSQFYGNQYINTLEKKNKKSLQTIKRLKEDNQRLSNQIRELKKDIAIYGSAFKNHIDPIVIKIYNNLKLDEQSRISVYFYSARSEKMFLVGRHSSSTILNKIGTWVISDKNKYCFSILNLTEKQYDNLEPVCDTASIMQGKTMYGIPIVTEKGIKIGAVIFQHKEQAAWKKNKKREMKKQINSEMNNLVKTLSQGHMDDFVELYDCDDTFDKQLMEDVND